MATQGPNSPGTTANDASVGTRTWSNVGSPGNAGASDNAYSQVTTDGGPKTSQYLKATNFGFSIPAGSTINGIEVNLERKKTLGDGDVTHNQARIVKAGTISTSDKTVTWPTTEAVQTLGSSSDLWGETWTADDINSSTTGFAVSVNVDDGGGPTATAFVDHITMTVTYTQSSTSYKLTNNSSTLSPVNSKIKL